LSLLNDFFFRGHLILVFFRHSLFLLDLGCFGVTDIIKVLICLLFFIYIILQFLHDVLVLATSTGFSRPAACRLLGCLHYANGVRALLLHFNTILKLHFFLTRLIIDLNLRWRLCNILFLFFLFRRRLLRKVVLLFEILNPRVIENLDERNTLRCLIDQYLVNEVFVLVGESWLESDLSSHDFVADFPRMNTCERSSSMHQLVQQDSE
jgi:hypothetical protein